MKTPLEHIYESEQRRKADIRDNRLADAIAWGIIAVIIICMLIK